MTTEETGRPDPNETISHKAHIFVACWATGIVLFYLAVGIVGTAQMRKYRLETQRLRHAWLNSETARPSAPTPGMGASPTATTPVGVNVVVTRIGDFSLKEGRWETDFDISFRWKGDAVNPGETFRIANGEILRREKVASKTVDGERYERYQVKARLERAFDPSRFPFGEVELLVEIEDVSESGRAVVYQVYGRGITVSPQTVAQGMKIPNSFAGIRLHSYGQDDSARSSDEMEGHTRFVFAIVIEPRSREIYMKLFQALFASVAIALVVFFIKPTFVDPRFGLGVGAFFAAVGNNIFLGSLLPQANRVTLADMVNFIGLVTIFLTLVQSTISLHFCDTDRWRLSRFFDRLCFPLFLLGYAVVNFLLPFVAKG